MIDPLISRLSFLLSGLVRTHPENFIIPRAWQKYRATILACLVQKDFIRTAIFQQLDWRNERLLPYSARILPSLHRRLVQILDKTLLQPYPVGLVRQYWGSSENLELLCRTLLQWSTSSYRAGMTKVYVGARLLRAGSKLGLDLDEAILSLLGSDHAASAGCNYQALFQLVAELTRSRHFSIAKYLQWAIARGELDVEVNPGVISSCAARLLAELPTHNLSSRVDALRRTLLSRTGYDVERETIEAAEIMQSICLALPDIPLDAVSHQYRSPAMSMDLGRVSASSRTIKSNVGTWLRHGFRQCVDEQESLVQEEEMSSTKRKVNRGSFATLRSILEATSDFSILADIISMAIPIADPEVVAYIADTLNLHRLTFAAIGALYDLFDKLLGRLHILETDIENAAIIILPSLTALASKIPDGVATARHLAQRRAHISRKAVAAACSPVSDQTADLPQNSETVPTDKIERILAGGTIMDHPTLRRLFNTIISRLEASWLDMPNRLSECCTLLSKLRAFDEHYFHQLLVPWIATMLRMRRRPPANDIMGPLIAVQCLQLVDALSAYEHILCNVSTELDMPLFASELAVCALELLVDPCGMPDIMCRDDKYQLRLAQLNLQSEQPLVALTTIRRVIECSTSNTDMNIPSSAAALLGSQAVGDLLRVLVVSDIEAVCKALVLPLTQSSHSAVVALTRSMIDGLLLVTEQQESSNMGTVARITQAIRLANELTLPFCQLELRLVFATEPTHRLETSTYRLDSLCEAIDCAIKDHNTTWESVIKLLDVDIVRHIRQRADDDFLKLVPSIATPGAQISSEDVVVATGFLAVVQATSHSLLPTDALAIALRVVDKINDVMQLVLTTLAEDVLTIIKKWFPLLLDFVTIHSVSFESTKLGFEARGRLAVALASLFLELQHHDQSALVARIFDITLHLADDLSEESRIQCARLLRDKTNDPRIKYLFGWIDSPTDWLQLSQKGRLLQYSLKKWENLSEPTPNIGENDTSLSLTLFEARKV